MKFRLDTILCVTTGLILSPRYQDMQKLLSFMTGQAGVDEKQTISAGVDCKDELLKQFPWLAEATKKAEALEGQSELTILKFLVELNNQYGEYHEVAPLAQPKKYPTTAEHRIFGNSLN